VLYTNFGPLETFQISKKKVFTLEEKNQFVLKNVFGSQEGMNLICS
jgi:hypothetical protein